MIRVSIASEPASADHPNEDFVGATANAAVLLDGAGSGSLDTGCIHGVAWFARQLGAQILARVDDLTTGLPHVLAASIEATGTEHLDTCDLSNPATPSATVVIARFTPANLEYLVLADSVLLIAGATGDVLAVCDNREQQVGARYRSTMDRESTGTRVHDVARDAYIETLLRHRNHDGGFWVAAADPSAAGQAITGERPSGTFTSVVLLSDGATRLVDRFRLSTWDEAVRTVADLGPDDLIAKVRRAEHLDPLGLRWPRGKARDDATVAFVELIEGRSAPQTS